MRTLSIVGVTYEIKGFGYFKGEGQNKILAVYTIGVKLSEL